MNDPNVNTQAEIYAQIRDKALEEAAKCAESVTWDEAHGAFNEGWIGAAALKIRALKRQP